MRSYKCDVCGKEIVDGYDVVNNLMQGKLHLGDKDACVECAKKIDEELRKERNEVTEKVIVKYFGHTIFKDENKSSDEEKDEK